MKADKSAPFVSTSLRRLPDIVVVAFAQFHGVLSYLFPYFPVYHLNFSILLIYTLYACQHSDANPPDPASQAQGRIACKLCYLDQEGLVRQARICFHLAGIRAGYAALPVLRRLYENFIF